MNKDGDTSKFGFTWWCLSLIPFECGGNIYMWTMIPQKNRFIMQTIVVNCSAVHKSKINYTNINYYFQNGNTDIFDEFFFFRLIYY